MLAENEHQSKKIEIQFLLEAIYLKYGYDFRNYSGNHVERRLMNRLFQSNLSSLADMKDKLLNDTDFFHRLLMDLSVNVTEMFRDPQFFVLMREKIIPLLRTYPYIKIWHAGCSTGEEVYSMAMILKEENLLERSTLYATDFNQIALNTASKAIYPLDKIQQYNLNYHKAKGKASFSDYFNVSYNAAKIKSQLKKNIVFSDHNLVTDGVFGEMNIIFCRNVLIYFDRILQDHVYKLFIDSLINGGILCLGTKETMIVSNHKADFNLIYPNIYKKKLYRESI